ncbi:ATP-dependent helicase [Tsukamurella strandjordii]|uniref:ATP-dependent helicase n=1 Tax=Tsukamurella sp. TY48 TaxID=2775495 RepID=UPI001C7DB043|nr:ATP-dependent helicase [Tsukamurella sp. TY48]GIZ96223.1 putative ATP-dependent helicase Lhr [Tsukamurella sp. TY48]
MPDVLRAFTPATAEWFTESFAAPTAAQAKAWASIAKGRNTLVVAPTGSGKTLSAFLWALDRLADTAPSDRPAGTSVLYISPLKALAVDVERNLRAPLTGIARVRERRGEPAPGITVGVRSGDTPAQQRRQLVRTPPDVLITTPESLFLMLTSQARETLAGVHTVIVDEVHAVAGTKRGTHLALSLERLDALLERPAQRIGLSATVEPAQEVAAFLGGPRPATVVRPPSEKEFELTVTVPVPDMTELDVIAGDGEEPVQQGSLWPHVESAIVDLIDRHRSTIVFANSRRLAERLTARINELAAGVSAGGPNPAVAGGAPAQVLASGQTHGAEAVLARAHHGSVSKEQRAIIEDDLKSGRLRCVVATSSLELGIDMGAVDLVIQVEAPPSVAAGLQRVGRAGHQVGEPSRGVFFPKHRTDLLHSTVTVQRMREGAIEKLTVPRNPLDVLAQQTVAAAAMDVLDVHEWLALVRGAHPYAALPDSAYEAVLDLLSGRYPSEDFGELRPRLVWDRDAGTLTGRPGAGRLAVTSGGAIPDRGLFGVFMVGERASRVGELDEEMVYESRVGDVFALGATSWRIEEITHDRVLVSPAFGQPGRLPFWVGDTVGRPAELGRAIGRFTREFTALSGPERAARAGAVGLGEWATDNLVALLDEQQDATGVLPTDRTLVVERFRDELGDWRVALHSPLGMRVHAPWALAVGARLNERLGLSGAVTATDDGIVVRLPDTDDAPPGAELFRFDPDEIDGLVTEAVGSSALFASRFRECAARALLLPRRDPGKRSPLWQQRQRASQLLEVARGYPQFPIVLEAVRECLQDVYDVPELIAVHRSLESRSLRIAEVETASPSPFAASLLFSYVGAFMYEGDAPLAERRAAVLSLDPAVLSQLLGRVELTELLDADILAEVASQLQRTASGYRARTLEQVADLIRELGPLTRTEIADRSEGVDARHAVDELIDAGRAFAYGDEWVAAVEDAARLRDGLGVPLQPGIAQVFTEAVPDPIGDLIARYARRHGPFTAAQVAQRYGLGVAVVHRTLTDLVRARRVVEGRFITIDDPDAADAPQFCDAEVLRRIRQRSLARLRHDVEPVPERAYSEFLAGWHHLRSPLRGIDGVATVIDQLAGVPIPASAWESLILPQRVRDYSPAMLDELTTSGEVVWTGHGAIGAQDGWIALHPADLAPLTVPPPDELDLTAAHEAIEDAVRGGGAYLYRQLTGATPDALWDLVWAGRLSGDTFAPVRARLAGGRRATAHRSPRRPPRARFRMPVEQSPPMVAGRWSLPPAPPEADDPTVRSHTIAEQLLERYGVVTRGSVMAEHVEGGFARVYRTLAAFEESGKARRGYFIERLGAAQFARNGTVDALREAAAALQQAEDRGEPAPPLVLAATDPANPFGAALPWPERPSSGEGPGARPGRKPGAVVVLADGALAAFVERGGRTLLTFTDAPEAAFAALAEAVPRLGGLTIEKVDGAPALTSPLAAALAAAGFAKTPKGLRVR